MAQPPDDLAIPATNTNWSTGPHAGTVAKVEPSASELADMLLGGVSIKAQHLNWLLHNLASWIDDERDERVGDFGDGSDGNVTIGAGTTTLARDMYYANLTIEPGGVLATAGFRVFVRGVLAIEAGGQIRNNGGNGGNAGGAVGTSGAAAAAGSIGGGFAGGIGAEDGVGVGGTQASDALGGAGGAGGATTGVVRAGGTGGTSTAPQASDGGTRHAHAAYGWIVGGGNAAPGLVTMIRGGAGGGSGASVAAGGRSGGGGGGGGVISIHAHTILIDPDATPAIAALGGNAGTPIGPVEVGGSGGGGGGAILVAYLRLLDGTTVASATPREPADLAGAGIVISVAGGSPSNGINTGGNGVAGSTGTVRWWRI